MGSIMDDLLSTNPQRLYTKECAVQALRLPGTLSGDRCAGTLWCRSRTMLTLAACYPRLIASKNEADSAVLDLLITVGACAEIVPISPSRLPVKNPQSPHLN